MLLSSANTISWNASCSRGLPEILPEILQLSASVESISIAVVFEKLDVKLLLRQINSRETAPQADQLSKHELYKKLCIDDIIYNDCHNVIMCAFYLRLRCQ